MDEIIAEILAADTGNNFMTLKAAKTEPMPSNENIMASAPKSQAASKMSVFHSAVDCTAQLTKEKAPNPSIIFDGLGLLTAGNLIEAAKSALSIIDTAKKLML